MGTESATRPPGEFRQARDANQESALTKNWLNKNWLKWSRCGTSKNRCGTPSPTPRSSADNHSVMKSVVSARNRVDACASAARGPSSRKRFLALAPSGAPLCSDLQLHHFGG